MSLIEVVIATGITALLLSLAIPGYRQHTMRAHRVAAIELLADAARCQGRIYVSEFHYDTTRCTLTDRNGHYRLQFDPPATNGTIVFTVAAIPQGHQANDPCGTLSLDHAGTRTISGATANLRRCWEGR
jgi:type IV pilus assembly protein PilE